MVSRLYSDEPNSEDYYINYYDDNYNKKVAISRIDEDNLNKIASDLSIDYIQMSKTSNINDKLEDIKKQIVSSQTMGEKVLLYKDIYYCFAIPLVILLIVEFVLKKRRMQ